MVRADGLHPGQASSLSERVLGYVLLFRTAYQGRRLALSRLLRGERDHPGKKEDQRMRDEKEVCL